MDVATRLEGPGSVCRVIVNVMDSGYMYRVGILLVNSYMSSEKNRRGLGDGTDAPRPSPEAYFGLLCISAGRDVGSDDCHSTAPHSMLRAVARSFPPSGTPASSSWVRFTSGTCPATP